MKIIAGNYFGKNIQFVCRCCNCVYEVESKDDWNVRMIFPNYCSFKYKVPEYEVACPNCKPTLSLDSIIEEERRLE